MEPIQSDGEAVPAAENPWVKARQLSKELSAALLECNGGRWAAHILPTGDENTVFFAAIDEEHPAQKVDRLAAEMCDALTHYQGGRFHARIFPEQEGGHGFHFVATKAREREGL